MALIGPPPDRPAAANKSAPPGDRKEPELRRQSSLLAALLMLLAFLCLVGLAYYSDVSDKPGPVSTGQTLIILRKNGLTWGWSWPIRWSLGTVRVSWCSR